VVYDLSGREIKRLVDNAQSAGAHSVQWEDAMHSEIAWLPARISIACKPVLSPQRGS
jgi:hypothetical protein